jgi:hypothetical protein
MLAVLQQRGACDSEHLHVVRAGGEQRARERLCRAAGGHHVVDDSHAPPSYDWAGGEHPGQITAPGFATKAALGRRPTCSAHRIWSDWHAQRARNVAPESERLIVPAQRKTRPA